MSNMTTAQAGFFINCLISSPSPLSFRSGGHFCLETPCCITCSVQLCASYLCVQCGNGRSQLCTETETAQDPHLFFMIIKHLGAYRCHSAVKPLTT